jgi:hypothetical protein
MTIRVKPVSAGTRGFDCNRALSPDTSRRFYEAGYGFAVRYVRRAAVAPIDLTAKEVYAILYSGLGLMVVQHVALPGWIPTSGLGSHYGQVAVAGVRSAVVPPGVTVWCDLEGVASHNSHQDTIEYCNAWYSAVKEAGYIPGLYVGDSCGLTPSELYYRLKFEHFWAAYNLNKDQYPLVRGVQMQQVVARLQDIPEGLGWKPSEIDVDVVNLDAHGSTPTMVVSSEL